MQVGLRPRLKARPSLVDLLVRGNRNLGNENSWSSGAGAVSYRSGSYMRSGDDSSRQLQLGAITAIPSSLPRPPSPPAQLSASAAPAPEPTSSRSSQREPAAPELEPGPRSAAAVVFEQATNLPLPLSPASTSPPQIPTLDPFVPPLSAIPLIPIPAPVQNIGLESPLAAPAKPAPTPIPSPKMAPVSHPRPPPLAPPSELHTQRDLLVADGAFQW